MVDVGPGVTSLGGDHVIRSTARYRQCRLPVMEDVSADAHRAEYDADGTSRFSSWQAAPPLWAARPPNYTVLPEIARRSADAPNKVCYVGCGVTRRRRRAQHGEGRVGSAAIVFGLGGIGLNVVGVSASPAPT